MSRVSRIPYHQNVFDLLDYEPPLDAGLLERIASLEKQIGQPLPSAVVDWYARRGVVDPDEAERQMPSCPCRWDEDMWMNFTLLPSFQYTATTGLVGVLEGFRRLAEDGSEGHPYIPITTEAYDACTMEIEPNGSDDPPVRCWGSGAPTTWRIVDNHFSDFVFDTVVDGYRRDDTPVSLFPDENELWELTRAELGPGDHDDESWDAAEARILAARPRFVKRYMNGLWLRTPSEPFEPAVIDYLTEQFGEPEHTPRPGNVTTYTFRPTGSTIRVTADEPGLGGGLSAWWIHADTPERLTELGRLILPFGSLRETLRADTALAKRVLESLLQ
jgi:hypothetical protein